MKPRIYLCPLRAISLIISLKDENYAKQKENILLFFAAGMSSANLSVCKVSSLQGISYSAGIAWQQTHNYSLGLEEQGYGSDAYLYKHTFNSDIVLNRISNGG